MVLVKKNVNPELLLEDPKKVLNKFSSRSQSLRDGQDAVAVAAREIRDIGKTSTGKWGT